MGKATVKPFDEAAFVARNGSNYFVLSGEHAKKLKPRAQAPMREAHAADPPARDPNSDAKPVAFSFTAQHYSGLERFVAEFMERDPGPDIVVSRQWRKASRRDRSVGARSETRTRRDSDSR